jgi:serine/threonine protein kinase
MTTGEIVDTGAYLRWPHGQGEDRSLSLHGDGPTIFGRGSECDHKLPGRFFSRRHFMIVPDAAGYLLFDLGSRNGTYLDDRWVRIARLAPGNVVRAGDRLLIFEDGRDESPRCDGCDRKLPAGGSGLCLVCRHRYPRLGETVAGVEIAAPLDERPGLADYQGRDEKTGEPRRLRILERGYRRSLKVVASFEHPRLVKVHACGKHDGTGVLVTEPPRPVTLANLITTRLPVPADLVEQIMRGTAEVMALAHREGIVHGALLAEAIRINDRGEACVDDLGLGELLPMEESESDWSVPPERRGNRKRPEKVDDVFAFGATFYHVLARRPPMPDYASGNVDGAKPLASRRPDLPGRIAFVIGRALASDPKERYRTFEEILGDLE